MAVSNFSKAKTIPSKVTTRKSAPTTTNFAKGIYTYKPNDTMDFDEIYLAQNARFERIGEYKTRRGLKKFTNPIDRSKTTDNYTTTYEMVPISTISEDATYASTLPLCSMNLTLAAETEDDYCVVQLIAKNSSDEVVGISCAEITSTEPTDTQFDFIEGVEGTVTWSLAVQGATPRSVKVAVVTGQDTNSLMQIAYCSIPGKVTNVFEANINDVKHILLSCKYYDDTVKVWRLSPDAQGNYNAYQVDLTLGSVMPSIQKIRFQQNINKLRAVTGFNRPRLIDPSDSWNVSPIPTTDLKTGTDLHINTSNILDGTQDNIMYFNQNVNTQALWTYPYNFEYNNAAISSYDKFDVDFYQNFPAIETGDPLTAMFNLGGVVYILTRRNKYYIYYQTADVWTQQASSAQHGTFSQESCVCDLNYAYYACDDGIYMFDGSSEASLTEKTIQSTYDAIPNKESIVMDLYKNRLYVFYSSNGDGVNDSCLVYNINLRLWESFDTGTCVSATCARKSPSNRFYCGSSKFCQLFTYEDESADYADLGAPIDFDLETCYMHFGTPSQLHRITKWRPEFAKVTSDYAVKCGYALDFTDDVKYAFSINLKNRSVVNEHYVWDNPPDYGNPVTPTKLTTIPQVNGQFHRCQIRYQLHGAFVPVNFKSHTLACETQRLR